MLDMSGMSDKDKIKAISVAVGCMIKEIPVMVSKYSSMHIENGVVIEIISDPTDIHNMDKMARVERPDMTVKELFDSLNEMDLGSLAMSALVAMSIK